ncbi:unnamed protein product, partial [Pylaiella littoralis]
LDCRPPPSRLPSPSKCYWHVLFRERRYAAEVDEADTATVKKDTRADLKGRHCNQRARNPVAKLPTRRDRFVPVVIFLAAVHFFFWGFRNFAGCLVCVTLALALGFP